MVASAECGLTARPGDRFCRRCGSSLADALGAPTASVPVTASTWAPPDDDVTSVTPLSPKLPGAPARPMPAGHPGPGPAPGVAGPPVIMVRPTRPGRGLVAAACVLAVLLAAGVGLLASGVFRRSTNHPTASGVSALPPPKRTGHHAAPTTSTAPTTTSSSSSTTTSTTAVGELSQAQAVAAIATQSGSARASVQNAVTDIGACGANMATDATTLQNQAATRHQLANQLGTLSVGAIPNGPAIVSALTQALQSSAAADAAYAAWGHDAAGCSGSAPADANSATAATADQQASTAKQSFADAWAPLAQSLGLPAITADQI